MKTLDTYGDNMPRIRLFFGAHVVLFLFFMFFWCGVSHAYFVYFNDVLTSVGEVDEFKYGEKLKNSGENQEKKWVVDVLGIDIDFKIKNEINGESWIQVDQKGYKYIYAFYIPEKPEYFLIKTGNNKNDNSGIDLTHFLFENKSGFDWAVINLKMFGADYTIKNIGKLSHLVEYDVVSMPEPSALLLLSFGLIGLSFVARRSRKC
jgi:hypothetical protein